MSASAGTFDGMASPRTVTLAGDGTTDAKALVLFRADADAIVNAQVGEVAATPQLVRVAGAATLAPPTATLAAGGTVAVDVASAVEGQVTRCDLGGAPGFAWSPLVDGRFTVTAPATVAAPAVATVTCRDHYGQTFTGSYRAEP